MTHRGFALLAVLWAVTAITIFTALALLGARTGAAATRNRLLLARAAWAREACAEILLARYAQDPGVRRIDSVDLGRGTWCRAGLEDLAAKLNVNLAPEPALGAVVRALVGDTLRADSSVDEILVLRRQGALADVAVLRAAPGMDSTLVGALETVLTTRGPGLVDVNAAAPAVLAGVPGLGEEARTVLLDRRTVGRPVESVDELLALLSTNARAVLVSAYSDFAAVATFAPRQLLATVEGGVQGSPLQAQVAITLVPMPGRLAVIRRETE